MAATSYTPTNYELASQWRMAGGDPTDTKSITAAINLFDMHESVKCLSESTKLSLGQLATCIQEAESRLALDRRSNQYDSLISQFNMRVISYRYRTEMAASPDQTASDTHEHQQMGTTLRIIAEAWFADQKLKSYRHKANGDLVPINTLAPHQLESLREALKYPEFCKLILFNLNLRIDFFKWALIDGCPVAPYVEFFGTCQNTVKKVFLHKRIGYYRDDNPLKIKRKMNNGVSYKRLTLPFESAVGGFKDRSISHKLDKPLTFTFGFTATKRQVFQEFSEKKERPGRFETFQGGVIRNWDYFNGRSNGLLGGYDSFELDTPDWFERLPPFDTFTEAEMRARFHVTEPLGPLQWVMVVSANQEAPVPNMDIAATHGVLMFLIPVGAGKYQLYPFTFLSPEFTTGCTHRPYVDIFLKVMRLGKTERGIWVYADETLFYSNRQHTYFPVVIDAQKGLETMELLRQFFLRSRAGNDPFQISYKNCAGSIQLFLRNIFPKEVVPNLFDADILESDPREPLGGFFRNVRQRPNWQALSVIWFFGFVLLAWLGIIIEKDGHWEYACMMRTPIFGPRLIFHAAKLGCQVLNKEVPGTITYTHTPKSYDKNVVIG